MQTRFTLGAVKNIKKYYPEMSVIVVDDGSGENKMQDFRMAYQRPAYSLQERLDNSPLPEGKYKIVSLPKHMGHGSSLDHGVDEVKTPLMLTMDNDIRILAGGLVEEYLDKMNEDPDNTYAVGTTFYERTCVNGEIWPAFWIDPWFTLYQIAPIKQMHLTFCDFTHLYPGHSSFHLGTGGFLHAMLTTEGLHRPKIWKAVHYPEVDKMGRLWHLKKFPDDQPGNERYDRWKELIDG
jgi:glycosyltransferase involved in cell wall biosynthesis